jgi:hypothetical protein
LDGLHGANRLTQAGVIAGFRPGNDGHNITHGQRSAWADFDAQATPVTALWINERYGSFRLLPVSLRHVLTPKKESLTFLVLLYHMSDRVSSTFVELGHDLFAE